MQALSDDGCRLRGGVEDGDSVEDPPEDAAFLEHFGILDDIDFDTEDPENGGVDPETHDDHRWSQEMLASPLYPGCRYSVEQYSYAMFKIKTGSIHDDRADKLCKLVAEIMPEGFKGPKCDPTAGDHCPLPMFRLVHVLLPVCRRHNAMPLVCGCPGVILYQYGTEASVFSTSGAPYAPMH